MINAPKHSDRSSVTKKLQEGPSTGQVSQQPPSDGFPLSTFVVIMCLFAIAAGLLAVNSYPLAGTLAAIAACAVPLRVRSWRGKRKDRGEALLVAVAAGTTGVLVASHVTWAGVVLVLI